MKYNTCPYCGSHLDFGERCDCRQEKGAAETGKGGEQRVGDKPATSGRVLPRHEYLPARVANG